MVKPWFTSRLKNSTTMPCIADSWNQDKTLLDLDSKIQFAKLNPNICTDITCADCLTVASMVKLKGTFALVKIVTDYESDIANLDPAWNPEKYDQTQWLIASMYGLALSDDLIFWNKPNLPSIQTAPPVIFTTGRSGTHVLREVLNVENYHHDSNRFQQLIDAEFIGAVARKSFLKYLLSTEIARQHQLLLTTNDSLQTNQQLVKHWKSIHIGKDACDQLLTTFVNYVDLLLGLFYFYNKSVKFSFFEDLSDHYDSIKIIKNPYHAPDLCANYNAVAELCETTYQPIYENILKKLQLLFGSNCYKHE